MTLRFGTDGVRGVANLDLTPELVVALGRAAARVLGVDRFVIGRDTRISGPSLEAALTAGLDRRRRRPSARSASCRHRRWRGRRRIRRGGGHDLRVAQPLSRQRHQAVHSRWSQARGRRRERARSDPRCARAQACGRRTRRPPATRSAPSKPTPEHLLGYAEAVAQSIEGATWPGCGSWSTAPTGRPRPSPLMSCAGSEPSVVVLHAEPNGTNINEGCGSTHPDDLQRAVVDHGADAGLAFDGDADRVLAVDRDGDAGRRRPDHRHQRASICTSADGFATTPWSSP